jgi:hypothetical protein
MIGEPAAAREHCEAGRSLYDPERHRSHRLLYGGHDPGICAGYMGAQAYWLPGYPEHGLRIGREALALAEASVTRSASKLSCYTWRRFISIAVRGDLHVGGRRLDEQQRRGLVWEIERRLAEDGARPIIHHSRQATCRQPYVKGFDSMINSVYNGWRFEDLWLDK